MKKIFLAIMATLALAFATTSCTDNLSNNPNTKTKLQEENNNFIGEWELIELSGGFSGIEQRFESPSPKTLKVSKLDDGLYFTYSNLLHDYFGGVVGKYIFVEDVSAFDLKKHIMLGTKTSLEGFYSTILFEFRENGNYMVLDDNCMDGFHQVYKRIK